MILVMLLTGCGVYDEPHSLYVPCSVSGESGYYYIGNKNSLKFHQKNCVNLPLENNRVYFDTREQAIAGGYIPCENCNL